MTNQRAIILLSQMYLPAFDEEEKQAIDKAIEALTAQEPRVMTLEEIDQWKQLDVWMEKKGGEPDLCGDYIMPMSRLEFSFWHAIIVDGSKYPPIINGDYYGKTWRCWSARPSYEQMEATPWQE